MQSWHYGAEQELQHNQPADSLLAYRIAFNIRIRSHNYSKDPPVLIAATKRVSAKYPLHRNAIIKMVGIINNNIKDNTFFTSLLQIMIVYQILILNLYKILFSIIRLHDFDKSFRNISFYISGILLAFNCFCK